MRIINREETARLKPYLFSSIKKGAIFIHPTDTIYGLGCDATNWRAVKALRELKNRYLRPFSVIAPDKKWILKNCRVENKNILEKLPGEVTLVFKMRKSTELAPNVSPLENKIGVRIPNHWMSELVKELGFPIVTTSANITGETFMNSLEDMHPAIKEGVEFIVYEGEKKGKPSRVIDCSEGRTKVLR